jgi:NitT/TauT family transport system ATP-binding protein
LLEDSSGADALGIVEHSTASKIVVREISKSFKRKRAEPLVALAPVSFEIRQNETLCIMGPSGCGKSTILNILAGLVQSDSGGVEIDGRPVTGPGRDRAMCFQADAVFPWLTVVDNIAYSARVTGRDRGEQRRIASEFIQLVGLSEFESAWPKELSGGMRKRVDVARALAAGPSVLLMDEPFGALDVLTKEVLQEDLSQLLSRRPTTTVFVTHDLEEAIFLGDRVIVMTRRPGRIKGVFEVPIRRPRERCDKTSPEFIALRRTLMDCIDSEIE